MDGSYCTYSAYGETGDCTAKECQDPQYPDLNPGGYTGQLQCGVYQPTNVISISYSYEEWGLPDYYTKRQCDEFMKLSLQGVTIVMSSGDSGVGGDGECRGEDGDIFSPYGGTTCPYVLGVGSTEWNRKDPSAPPQEWEVLEEVATKRFGSGSGFSNIFGIPSYQRAARQGLLRPGEAPLLGLPPLCHRWQLLQRHRRRLPPRRPRLPGHRRRGRPPARLRRRQLVERRRHVAVGPRRWSRPDAHQRGPHRRRQEHRGLHPPHHCEFFLVSLITLGKHADLVLQYAHPEAFTDITVGNSPGCGSDGFVAAPGWDPVTGLG